MSDDLAARLARLDAWAADPVVHRTVGELAARDRWKEALERARAAIRAGAARDRVLLALAHGALEGGRPDRCAKALKQLSPEALDAEALPLRVEVLVAEGRTDEARRLVDARRLSAPGQPELEALARRLIPPAGPRGALPLATARHARALLAAGAPGRALRVVRRLRLDHPDDAGLLRLARECAAAVAAVSDHLDDVLAGLPLPELNAGASSA